MNLPGCSKSGRKEKKKHVLNQCFAFAAQKEVLPMVPKGPFREA